MIARRYGVLPTEVLKLDLKEFAFVQITAAKGLEEETRAHKEASKKRGR